MKVNKTLVVISAMISLVMLLATSCGSKDQDERYSPYKFNATALDSLVDLKQALIDVVYRPDSSIREKRYYLGDSVKMVLTYNKQGYDNARFQHHGHVPQDLGASEGVVLHGNDVGHSARHDGAYVIGKAHVFGGDRSR